MLELETAVEPTLLNSNVSIDRLRVMQAEAPVTTSVTSTSAAEPGPAETEQGQAEQAEGAAELLTTESFRKRAKLIFLRGGDILRESGMDLAAEESTNQIILLAVDTGDWLYDMKKSGYGLAKVQESCGQVDKQESIAYLINDALGGTIIPKGPEPGWPRSVGRDAQIQAPKAKHQASENAKTAAKKAAKGGALAKEQAREEARAAVMLKPFTLSALPALPKPKRKAPEAAPEAAPEPAPKKAPEPKLMPTPAAAPAAAPAPAPEPKSKPPSKRAKAHSSGMAACRARILADWDNTECRCDQVGAPHVSDPNFQEHSMFCQMFKCYSYEIKCCDPDIHGE